MIAPQRFGDLQVAVEFAPPKVLVRVVGEVDLLTSPTVTALLAALVHEGHRTIVLDLGACTFLDAAGLRTIATTAETLAAAGGSLVVRDARPIIVRILTLTEVADLVRLEPREAEPSNGSERPVDRMVDVVGRPDALGQPLVFAGSIHADQRVVDAALELVTATARSTIDGADGVSVTLDRRGRWSTVAASNDTVMEMDRHQYETGEGPCLDAAKEGHGVHAASLASELRWPAFRPLALGEGIASILSTPLVVEARSVGALNIYSNTADAFDAGQRAQATRLAEQASAILLSSSHDDQHRDGLVGEALAARQTIAHAQGIIMARHHLGPDAAATSLRRAARGAGLTVLRCALDIVAAVRHAETDEVIGDA